LQPLVILVVRLDYFKDFSIYGLVIRWLSPLPPLWPAQKLWLITKQLAQNRSFTTS